MRRIRLYVDTGDETIQSDWHDVDDYTLRAEPILAHAAATFDQMIGSKFTITFTAKPVQQPDSDFARIESRKTLPGNILPLPWEEMNT